MVLPRRTGVMPRRSFPYGVTLGLFGPVRGWRRDGLQLLARGRRVSFIARPAAWLNLTALLWPSAPLSQAPQMSRDDDGATHYRPAERLRIGLHYEQQVRVVLQWRELSLGLLTDLAALYARGLAQCSAPSRSRPAWALCN